jgi:hypothetical protein
MEDQIPADPMAMQAAIAQLAGLVTGLQSEVQRLTALQTTPVPAQEASPSDQANHGQGPMTAASSEVAG